MKKQVVAILLSGVLAATVVSGCSSTPTPKEDTNTDTSAAGEEAENEAAEEPAPEETDTEEPAQTEDTTDATASGALPAEGKLKTSQGIITSISSSAPATAEEAGTAQVDTVIAAVTYDAAGVITKCIIDTAQTKVNFNTTGQIESDLAEVPQTKLELGTNYGLKSASAIGKEWDEQSKAYSDWVIGKTLDEVKGMQVKKVDESHPAVPDIPELTSSVSLSVGDFISVIEKAMNSEGYEFDAVDTYTTGLAVISSIGSSKPATDSEEGLGQVDSAITTLTMDGDGKIVANVMDAAQTKINFDNKGQITTDLNTTASSKVELGDNYGMKKASKIGKEWYEQIKAFSDWTIGKTVDEVSGLKVKKVDETHPFVPDIPELSSSVSISLGDYLGGVDKAAANAK
jgi:hypothetical protein